MASTLTTLMQRALYELDVGMVVPNADVSAFAATTFTAARFFQNTNMASDFLQVKQAGLVRAGAASSADFWRPAGTLTNSSGVVNQVGANWADTTVGSEEIEIWYYGVRRDQEALKSLNRVCEFKHVTSMHMLSHGSRFDYGIESTTDTNWTNIGSPTTSDKVTSGTQRTPYGPRGYNLINASANEGTRSQAIVANQSSLVSGFGIASPGAGNTASMQLYDSTNSAAIGTAITSAYGAPVLLAQQSEQLPSTCRLVSLSLTGVETTANIIWNQVGIYKHDSYSMQLPGFVTESFMAPRLYIGRPQVTIAANVYDAMSLEFQPLVEGQDYWMVFNQADVFPYKVRFRDASYYQWPIFLEYRRPLSDLTTFSAETDSTTGPLHELLPAFKKDLLETVYNTGSRRHPDWTVQHNLAIEQMNKASNARPVVHIGNPKPIWTPRLSAS